MLSARSVVAAAAAFAVAMGGCASSGVKVDESQIAQFRPGVTTYQDVVAKLGAPTSTFATSGGIRAASYTYASYQTRPETFIPIVGAFAGGGDMRTQTVTFMFGPDNLLQSYTSGGSRIGTGTGLEAGSTPTRTPGQPTP